MVVMKGRTWTNSTNCHALLWASNCQPADQQGTAVRGERPCSMPCSETKHVQLACADERGRKGLQQQACLGTCVQTWLQHQYLNKRTSSEAVMSAGDVFNTQYFLLFCDYPGLPPHACLGRMHAGKHACWIPRHSKRSPYCNPMIRKKSWRNSCKAQKTLCQEWKALTIRNKQDVQRCHKAVSFSCIITIFHTH